VKDVLSILRWIDNPRGRIAGFRALRLLPGVGPATAARWLDALESAGEPIVALQAFAVPTAAANVWQALVALYGELNSAGSEWPGEMDSVLDWYQPQLERIHDDAPLRAADLAQLRRIAATYPSRERFLTELTLDPPAAAASEAGAPHLDEDYLTLSTIHSAKGLEWKAVAVLNGVDGCIPSDMATGKTESIEEERRLLYVAMTRAKDHLAIVLPHRFYVRQQAGLGDRHVSAVRSRFLTAPVCERFEQKSWPIVAASAPLAAGAGGKVDLGARIKAAWSAR
jgi:DNA helicase-2/ATP-dependent DNA helicase PcrA